MPNLVGAITISNAAYCDLGLGDREGGGPLQQSLEGYGLVLVQWGGVDVVVLGDPDGTGTARLRVNPGQGEICYELMVSGIAPAVAAHIHEAPAGAAGPVVVPLAAPSDGSSEACVPPI